MEILRGRGMAKVKIFKQKYEATLEFLEGWGVGANQNPSMGGLWVFSGTSQCNKDFSSLSLIIMIHLPWRNCECLGLTLLHGTVAYSVLS